MNSFSWISRLTPFRATISPLRVLNTIADIVNLDADLVAAGQISRSPAMT